MDATSSLCDGVHGGFMVRLSKVVGGVSFPRVGEGVVRSVCRQTPLQCSKFKLERTCWPYALKVTSCVISLTSEIVHQTFSLLVEAKVVNERHCCYDMMSTDVKVQCNCNYKCGRLERGFDMVCQRTRKRHSKFDAEGKLCAAKFVVNRGLLNRAFVISSDAQGCSAAIGTSVQVSRQT